MSERRNGVPNFNFNNKSLNDLKLQKVSKKTLFPVPLKSEGYIWRYM